MNKLIILLLTSVCLLEGAFTELYAQKDSTRDNASESNWSSVFKEVGIPSSSDGKIQKAYLYASKSKQRQPLIVSLHIWSGDYTQKDFITNEILARDWNYIHPDFRGPNNTPESMGSKLVIADIEDAIQYALKNTNADPDDVHILGVSGGGYATLVAYMNIHYPVKSFSAWAPISDLEAWYWESVGRNNKYAADIFKAVSSDSTLNREEALLRSPLMQKYPRDLRKNAMLYIYEGVHDGYTGSVPVTHSINMYNRLAGELKYGISNPELIRSKAETDSTLVSDKEIISLVTKRFNPSYNRKESLFGRNIYLYRKYENVRLTIFEGGHEQMPQALGMIPVSYMTSLDYNILTLGDSNGQNKDGWVDQLKKMMPASHFVNISRGGRTIGFDNNGQKDLNTLGNIDNYLEEARAKIGDKKYDFVILCMGTNDTKRVFADRQNEVVINFDALLKKIKEHPLCKKDSPKFIYVTPPPLRVQNIDAKYEGSNQRLSQLIPQLTNVATKNGFQVVDVYNPLLGILDYYAADGVHMAGPGQVIIASRIIEAIQKMK